ncbi:MAG: PrsW family intramembrane metalloprotease [Planctomycetes bacterium]|nr:PrsW family intramembrane metalloprotease [Planctomycetota bacterium]
MELALTLSAALLPSLALLLHFYLRDRNREPAKVVRTTFILGVLITIPAGLLGAPILMSLQLPPEPWAAGLIVAFAAAGIPEECFKFLVLRGYAARKAAFDEPMDGIVYGVAASLGFAALENVLYVLQGGWAVAITRAFTAVPAHACFGAIMGYFVGRSRINKIGSSLIGLVAAILAHGLYDWPLITLAIHNGVDPTDVDTPTATHVGILYGLSTAVLIFCALWVHKLVVRLRAEQLAAIEAVARDEAPHRA